MSLTTQPDLLAGEWMPTLPKGAITLVVTDRFPHVACETPRSLPDEVATWCEDNLDGIVRSHWSHRRAGERTEFRLWLLFASEADRIAFSLRWMGDA